MLPYCDPAINFYKILKPKHNIKVSLHGIVQDAVLVKFAYTPYPADTLITRRDSVTQSGQVLGTVPSKTANYWQLMGCGVTKGGKANKAGGLREWIGQVVPSIAVLVREVKEDVFDFTDAMVMDWPGTLVITGKAPWGLKVHGHLGERVANVFHLVEDVQPPVAVSSAVTQVEEKQLAAVIEEAEPDAEPEIEPAVAYTGDPFTRSEQGHFVGNDGFLVPRNFEEFYKWKPNYIKDWVKKRLGKQVVDADVEDWESDLLLAIQFLPQRSKYREPGANGVAEGCKDVIQTFNPYRQYGASERRFRHFINLCLGNKFNTIYGQNRRDPVCRTGNYAYAAAVGPDEYGLMDDEHIHANSEYLYQATQRANKQSEDKMFLNEFRSFVNETDPTMTQVMEIISSTGTYGEAQQELGMTEAEFHRARNRLKQLSTCFMEDRFVPKQRKAYKKREKTLCTTSN